MIHLICLSLDISYGLQKLLQNLLLRKIITPSLARSKRFLPQTECISGRMDAHHAKAALTVCCRRRIFLIDAMRQSAPVIVSTYSATLFIFFNFY